MSDNPMSLHGLLQEQLYFSLYESTGKIIISYTLMFSCTTYRMIKDREPNSSCNLPNVMFYFLPLKPLQLYDSAYRNCYRNFILLGT
jgi:hypothetical protein